MAAKVWITGRPAPPDPKDDPLFPWKPRMPFKKGLATDIVMGDDREYQPRQNSSTFASDYSAYRGGRPLNIAHKREADLVEAAGQPLGINCTSKMEQHISFGDEQKLNAAKYKSVTSDSFQAPETVDDLSLKLLDIRDKANSQSGSGVGPWISRPQTLMAAAHVGTKTREDLPVDNQHFKSFLTTNQESQQNLQLPFILERNNNYHSSEPKGREQFGPDVTPAEIISSLAAESNTTKQKLCERNHKSSIPQGDIERQANYSTVASTSFKPHGHRHYHVEKAPPPIPAKFLSGDQDSPRDMYVTTNASQYAKKHVRHLMMDTRGWRGRSSIPFGETELDRKRTHPTVTQRDFYEHRDPPKRVTFMRGCYGRIINDGSAELQLERERRLGMAGALKSCKTDEPFISCSHSQLTSWSSDEIKSTKDSAVAGNGSGSDTIPTSVKEHVDSNEEILHGPNQINVSSVPTGTHHPMSASFQTTTQNCFQPYPDAEFPTFPILGERITKSSLGLGEPLPEALVDLLSRNNFKTTSGDTYIHHRGAHPATPPPPRGALVVGEEGEYPMEMNRTTQMDHFQPKPYSFEKAKPHPSVAKGLIFPFFKNNTETTTNHYFRKRDGIVQVEHPSLKTVKKNANNSGIVFGDPKVGFYGDPSYRPKNGAR
ncbi:uncharacterized protein BJ171DRAFT_495058 [Polychytrium aggregatum]|uniref:uncharacterized protein n=1 Tax=Polychytrium aggregatum TaxID=110093 RepID=UPI0022FF208B|nr:uncharacterized protein BJ171DRAFT_495058 [Polychytrium aggregatum]KAI9206889.1 hypothetical protein BJ171DRAFT_495058 [Polychytrium aggregatum]